MGNCFARSPFVCFVPFCEKHLKQAVSRCAARSIGCFSSLAFLPVVANSDGRSRLLRLAWDL
jgi:hypothetical protein